MNWCCEKCRLSLLILGGLVSCVLKMLLDLFLIKGVYLVFLVVCPGTMFRCMTRCLMLVEGVM